MPSACKHRSLACNNPSTRSYVTRAVSSQQKNCDRCRRRLWSCTSWLCACRLHFTHWDGLFILCVYACVCVCVCHHRSGMASCPQPSCPVSVTRVSVQTSSSVWERLSQPYLLASHHTNRYVLSACARARSYALLPHKCYIGIPSC